MIYALMMIAFFGLMAYGWVNNIIMLVSCDWVITAEEVIRSIGIFVVPLGWVMGFIGHF